MSRLGKSERVESVLSRAAEHLGDVTGPAMTRFYRRVPEALNSFETHGLGNRTQLEGLMIENALYCLMYWFERPGEVAILLEGSVLHHSDTLDVPPHWYAELLDAAAEVIADTIPDEDMSGFEVWQELRKELRGIIAGAA